MAVVYSMASPSLSRLPAHLFPLHPTLNSHLRSRSRFRPHPCSPAEPRTPRRSRLGSGPCSRHDFLFIIPVALISPRYHVVGQALCVALEASDYLQVPSPVYKDYAARGKEVPGLLFGLFSDLVDTRALLPPFPFYSRSVSRLRSLPSSHLRYCPRFRTYSYLASTLLSPPSFSLPPRLRSRPRSCLAIGFSPPAPFTFPIHSRHRPRSRFQRRSRSRPCSRLRPRSRRRLFLPIPRI